MHNLKGCITALITPMFNDGNVDFESLRRLVEWQIINGVDGLVILGSTAEAANLNEVEKLAIIHEVITITQNRTKIIVGSGTSSTSDTIEFIKKINQLVGIDFLLSLTPYYVKPTQEGLYRHFAQVAKTSKFPVILYNVPGRTSCDLSNKTVLRLAKDFKNIIGLKDATGDIFRCTELIKHKPEGFLLYSGDDATSMAFMLCGGDGVISATSNIIPKEFSAMCNATLANNLLEARKINKKFLELYQILFIETNPIPVKWALASIGKINTAALRLPLIELSQTYHAELLKILVDLNVAKENTCA